MNQSQKMELNFSASTKSSSESTKQTPFSVKSGDLKLRLNNPKNIFYAEDVCAFEILPDSNKFLTIKMSKAEDVSICMSCFNASSKTNLKCDDLVQ